MKPGPSTTSFSAALRRPSRPDRPDALWKVEKFDNWYARCKCPFRYHGLTFWSPNINIFRDPRWGRGQETYGEDPYPDRPYGRGLHPRAARRRSPLPQACGHRQAFCRAQRTGVVAAPFRRPRSASATCAKPICRPFAWRSGRRKWPRSWARTTASTACRPAPTGGCSATSCERSGASTAWWSATSTPCIDVCQSHHYRPELRGGRRIGHQAGCDLNGGPCYNRLAAAVRQRLAQRGGNRRRRAAEPHAADAAGASSIRRRRSPTPASPLR